MSQFKGIILCNNLRFLWHYWNLILYKSKIWCLFFCLFLKPLYNLRNKDIDLWKFLHISEVSFLNLKLTKLLLSRKVAEPASLNRSTVCNNIQHSNTSLVTLWPCSEQDILQVSKGTFSCKILKGVILVWFWLVWPWGIIFGSWNVCNNMHSKNTSERTT